MDQTETPRRASAARSRRAIAIALAVTVVLLAGDLALKWWSFESLGPEPVDIAAVVASGGSLPLPDDSITLVPGVLSMKLTLNPGAVFGMMAGRRGFFVVTTIVAAIVVVLFFARSRSDERWLHLALAFIMAGAMGNMYDRIVHTVVRDMLWLFPGVSLPFGWTWPGGSDQLYPWIFNLADVYLLTGIGVLLVRSLFHHEEPGGEAAGTPA